MKKTAVIMVAVVLIISGVTAVVGHNATSEGNMGITSNDSATTASGANQNGTQYTAQVEMRSMSMNQTGNQIQNITHSESSITFEGTITASTPCHIIDHEVNQAEEGYILNVETVRNELEEDQTQVCTEVITGLNYDAEFEADPGFQLEIQHDSETVETVVHGNNGEEVERKSWIKWLLNILGL